MNHTALAMLAVLVCSPILVQAADGSGQESNAQTQIDKYSFLLGDWNCAGRVFAHGKIAAHLTTAQAHGTKVVDNRWILFRYDEETTAENPKPFHIDQYFGYDLDSRQFVSVALDTGGYFSETSPELVGDSISFDETTDGKIVGHDSFSKMSQDEILHVGRSLNNEGKWVETDEEICRKAR